MSKWMAIPVLFLAAATAVAQTRTRDVIYHRANGAAFTMDVFQPEKPNKAGVVVMVSGGWYSDHEMLKTFASGIEKALGDAGFTVFAVVHGAQPRYKVNEIVDQVRTAVKYIHSNAEKYGVDKDRIGITGISSGGHLSLMAGAAADTPLKAVAAIAPPTDLGNWGKSKDVFVDHPELAVFVPALGIDPKAPKNEIEAKVKSISPITYFTAKYPATLIVHGEKDTLVPIQQAEVMDKALANAGVDHKLVRVAEGGHDGATYIPGVTEAIAWFRAKLLK